MSFNYPTKKTAYKKITNNSRRGMSLEEDINLTNEYYLANSLAVIHKKPTPIQVVDVSYPSRNKALITKAFYRVPSTTDYNGVYKGKYIDFEAKETILKTSFPLRNIHDHQIVHLRKIVDQGGIGFLIICFKELGECYCVDFDIIYQYYISDKRKSIPYQVIKEKGFLLHEGYHPRLDYIKYLDEKIKDHF